MTKAKAVWDVKLKFRYRLKTWRFHLYVQAKTVEEARAAASEECISAILHEIRQSLNSHGEIGVTGAPEVRRILDGQRLVEVDDN